MVIVCSSSSCIDGSHQSSRSSQLFAPRPSCDGTEPASADIGVGNPAPLGGRPQIDATSGANPADERRQSAVGSARIHGELLKLGFEVAQSSVAKYMVKRCGPPTPGWRAFLRNRAPDIAAMDLFIAPTIGFDLLYVLVIVRLERRKLVGSTSHAIRPRNGLHARSQRHSLGMRPRAT